MKEQQDPGRWHDNWRQQKKLPVLQISSVPRAESVDDTHAQPLSKMWRGIIINPVLSYKETLGEPHHAIAIHHAHLVAQQVKQHSSSSTPKAVHIHTAHPTLCSTLPRCEVSNVTFDWPGAVIWVCFWPWHATERNRCKSPLVRGRSTLIFRQLRATRCKVLLHHKH